MAAITADKNILEKYNPASFRHKYNGTNATQFFKGGLVGILGATGLLVKATSTAVNLQVIGVCEDNILTTNATTRVGVKSGIFKFVNGDTIVSTDIGKLCFIGDDQTVFKANAGDDPVAGVIYDVDTDLGVWVAINFPAVITAKGTTAAGVGAASPFSGA
jgi:hypothetical protein